MNENLVLVLGAECRSGLEGRLCEELKMSRQFESLIHIALGIERELRALSPDKPSIRGWVSACLSRGGLVYEDIEAVKERLGGDFLRTRMVDCGAYVRDLRKYIAGGSLKESPAADRIQKIYFAQRARSEAQGTVRQFPEHVGS